MSDEKSKFVQSTKVDKQTSGGSKLISMKLTSDAQRALTVDPRSGRDIKAE